jgi:hypothetical protein
MLPRLALSVRQPWAYALVHRWKSVENRSWRNPNPGLKYRGEFCIHASKGMTRYEYEDAAEFMQGLGFDVPPPAELQRGGIIGVATIVDVVKEMSSPWFFGPRGLVIENARPVEFQPSSGALGFFAWQPMDPALVPAPARWMLPKIPPSEPEQEMLL